MSKSEKVFKKDRELLHGVTLETIVTSLQEAYGWEELGRQVRIKCFTHQPSINSSLKFLRKTPWAREKVESFYLFSLRKKKIIHPREQAP